MRSKSNIFTTLTVIMGVMFFAIIINVTLNLRELGIDSVKTKAHLVAQSVKNGLTAHMVNGIMQNRNFYITQTKNLENIDDLWIVRSDIVVNQYGSGTEMIKDEIDKKVLKNGNTFELIDENFLGHSTYRITIPYKAEITKNINCLTCHKAKEGDTLGAISMVMTMDDLKLESTKIIAYTSGISFVLMIIILFFVKYLIVPYLSIFVSIKDVMKKANEGNYE